MKYFIVDSDAKAERISCKNPRTEIVCIRIRDTVVWDSVIKDTRYPDYSEGPWSKWLSKKLFDQAKGHLLVSDDPKLVNLAYETEENLIGAYIYTLENGEYQTENT